MKKKCSEINISIEVSEEYIELCGYFLLYAQNLKANWMYSQKVFQEKLLPLAVENPAVFASMAGKMVEDSGQKIVSKGLFSSSIKYMKEFAKLKTQKVKYLSMALNDLLNSGLKDTVYAKKAIANASTN